MKKAPYRATKPLKWGMPNGQVVEVDTGDLVPQDDRTKYDRMVSIGLLERAAPGAVSAAPHQAAPAPDTGTDDDGGLDELTKDELWELVGELGLGEDDIEGTGANGNILKADLIRVLEDAG